MDLFEEIRREYEFGLASISGVARKFGVHRRMVREAIESSIPMRLPAKERPRPTIGPVAEFIDEILEDDRRARFARPGSAFDHRFGSAPVEIQP